MKITFRNFPWSLAILWIIAAIIITFFAYKTVEIYDYTHGKWVIESVNEGFAIVTYENHEVLVRSPIPDLKVGDVVELQGISYTGLPYIHKKVQ